MAAETAAELATVWPPFRRAFRIVPSRYPPVGIFDRLADPGELETLFEIEARTNDRLADELGLIDLIDPADRLVGHGTTPIMAAFTHPPPGGSRFTDGSFGVYYCSDTATVAIHESAFHRARFLRASHEAPCTVEMRLFVGNLRERLHDGLNGNLPHAVLDPDSYTLSQLWGSALRDAGAYGLLYPSVRRAGGRCAALFRPPAIGPVSQSAPYHFRFDGDKISHVFRVSHDRRLDN